VEERYGLLVYNLNDGRQQTVDFEFELVPVQAGGARGRAGFFPAIQAGVLGTLLVRQNYFPPERVEQIKRVYQHGVCGRSQHRHTVVVDRVGNIKMQELAKVFEEDELAAYLSQRLISLSERLEEKEQLVWIVDLSGKIMQLASKKILDALSKIILNLQRYFPNILHKLVFVNTPMLFDTIWTKITPLISPHTLDKVVMIGDEVENLYEFAEQSVLPDFLGGDIAEEDFLNDRQSVGSP
jgi:hypothetical protein